MNHEFDFIDLYYLNDITSDLSAKQSEFTNGIVEISALDDSQDAVAYTYAKFLEILDTKGLEGLVNV